MEMEYKKIQEWGKEEKATIYESWCDGALGDNLLFWARTQCIDENARNYRWSESQSKMCQMGEDEKAEHVVLEYERYDRDKMEMMGVILTELGC